MAVVLFENADHRCIVFNDLVRGDDGIQANQFLILDRGESALIDPGGALLYTPLSIAMSSFAPPKDLTWILASHQDPDIIGAVDRWLLYTGATVVCSKLWGRFVPHSVPHYQQNSGHADRYKLLPDAGGRIPLGASFLRALPAHFLHSVGNFSFYDPVSRILFSGDVGSSMITGNVAYEPVADFASHVGRMQGFHERYMGSNKVARMWVDMVRRLDPAMIVPQHGLPFDARSIPAFLDWLANLRCGIDLMEPDHYEVA